MVSTVISGEFGFGFALTKEELSAINLHQQGKKYA
jgi:hypothetical protein